MVDPGEECDDGNGGNDDGCSSGCVSELIPGSAWPWRNPRECLNEWLAPPVIERDRHGIPVSRITCEDDDPACDHGVAGDDACTFHVALCFNVSDMRELDERTGLPVCRSTGIQRVRVLTSGHPTSEDETSRAALETALEGIGAVPRGRCPRDGDEPTKLCATDRDCDTVPGRGDGECAGHLMAFETPLVDQDVCTDLATVVVPLRRTANRLHAGWTRIRLRLRPPDDPANGRRRPGDRDELRLRCEPKR